MWDALTRLGDARLLLPAALMLAAWLCGAAPPLALRWSLCFGGAVALVTASKIAFVAWGAGWQGMPFHMVSGHAMLAAALWPTIAYLALRRRARAARVALLLAAAGLSLLVGISRVVLQMHSWAEVVAGLALGFAVSAACIAQARGCAWPPMPQRTPLLLAAPLALLLAGAVGAATPSQHWIAQCARLVTANPATSGADD